MAKKRANHEGHFYKRFSQNGSLIGWGWQVRFQGRRIARYAKTQKEIQEMAAEVRRAMSQSAPITSNRQLSFGLYLDQWLAAIRPSIRSRTWDKRETFVRVHLKPGLGHIQLVKLSALDIQRFLNAKTAQQSAKGRPFSGETIADMRHILKNALNKAVKWRLLEHNPADATDPPRFQKRVLQVFTFDEAKAFVRSIEGDRLYALYLVVITLGLREGEVLGLRWTDVDFDHGRLTVTCSLQRVKGQDLQLVEPKTDRSKRSMVLPDFLVKALIEHAARQDLERQFAGTEWREHALVFPTTVGTPMYARNLLRGYARLFGPEAAFPRIRFHDLRHTAATFMLALGVSMQVVQNILGHSHIRQTMDTYAHLTDIQQEAAAEKLEELWGG